MSHSKEAILKRVREGLKFRREEPSGSPEKAGNNFIQSGELSGSKLTARFAERVGEYRADVNVIEKDELRKSIGQACEDHKVKKLILPADLSDEWVPDNVEPVRDTDGKLTHNELDNGDAVLTGCSLAIAQTGTIVLDGGKAQGRRALTLLPDFHICVVHPEQIVEVVPEAFIKLQDKFGKELPPVTFISGPSATSDIELNRVEGVHGPRRLHVFIVENGE